MKKNQVIAAQAEKSVADFARSLGAVLQKNLFINTNESTRDMAQAFQAHGAEVAPGFDLLMI
jgi:phosphopantothenate synthetase